MSNPAVAGELPKDAYGNAFIPLRPRDGAGIVQTRLHKARVVVEELAEYFAARRELESAYLKALQKISRRNFLSDPAALGPSFVPVYERLIAEIGQAASIHGELEKKIGQECEQAMRTAPNKGEWGRQRDHDDSISATLKEIQTLEQQLQKDQKKLEGASSKKAGSAQSKVIETQRSLDQTLELWQTEAPFAFEAYQRIDTQRLELMKEAVTRFETAQSDAAQRWMSLTEQTLQATLNFDPQAEMQEFILKNGAAGGAGLGRSTPSASATPQRRRTMMGRSDSIASSARGGAGSRTNGSATGAEFGTAGGAAGANSSSASLQSGTDIGGRGTNGGGAGGSTLRSAFSRFGRGRSNKTGGAGDTTTIYGGPGPGPSRSADEGYATVRPQTAEQGRRGTLSSLNENATSRSSFDDSTVSRGGAPPAGLMQPMTPNKAAAAAGVTGAGVAGGAAAMSSSTAPQVDSEGFSIPPPDRKPWEVPGGNLAEEEQEELADGNGSGVVPATQRMSTMNISNRPLSPSLDNAQDQAALERVRSTLLTSAAPARRNTTRRDRRDVRNTTYNPLDNGSLSSLGGVGVGGGTSRDQFGALSAQSTGNNAFASPTNTFTGTPGLGADRTQSIASVSSASRGAGVANPFEAPAGAPGLRASITETVNAIIGSGGAIARLMVVGEVSIALKDVQSTQSHLHLRLDQFEQLEKAAANPNVLEAIPSRPGEYKLNIESVSRGNTPTVTLLKYQVHVPADKMARYLPVNVDAKWRFEPHQTSLLINYTSNPECAASESVSDLAFNVAVGPTNVTNVMSKPEGSWDAGQKRITWSTNEATGKLLARFQVDGQGAPQGGVQVRWRAPGRTISSLGVELVEAGGLQFDEVARQAISGKYVAQ